MKRLLSIALVLVLCISISLTTFAAEGDKVLPSSIEASNIESVINTYVQEHEDTTAAVSVAVFTGSQVLMEKAYGYSDIENKIANNRDTVFEWGSITKLLVWTSTMQLVEKGDIDLNEDIRAYLPDEFFKKLKYDTPITMLNLMNHNAGWQETITDLFIADKTNIKELGDALQLIEPEQVHEPGSVLAYSNWGSALAGYIVECVSGQSFDSYVHEHIFEPLGMEHTALNATISDNEWVARKRGEQKHYTTENKPLGTNLYYLSLYPAGMATGTINDFIKFAQAFLTAEGEKSPLFKRAQTLEEMLSPSLFFADETTARNSHGFWTDELGVSVLWHNGGTLGSSSWFAFDPESKTGMIILTNQQGESIYNTGLLPLVFGKYKPMAGTIPEKDISGTYVPARTCLKGFAKLYSLISIMQFVKSEDGGYSVPGTNFTVTGISKDSYLIDMGGLKQFIAYTSTDKDGHAILQMPGSDYIQVNGYEVIAKYVLLVLFILAAFYGFFALIISFINLLRGRKSLGIMGKYRATVNASIIIVAMMFAYMAVKLFSNSPLFKDILWSIILNGILALFPVAYAVILASKWRNLDCTRREKRKLIITGIAGVIMTINVILWEVYKFW